METQTSSAGGTPPQQPSFNEHLKGLENFFDTYLHKKAPFHLPKQAKDFIVQYGPWIGLVLVVFGIVVLVPLLMLAFGLTVVSLPYQAMTGTAHPNMLGWLNILIGLVSLGLEAAAIPGLMKRKLSAWYLLYYASLVSALGQLLTLDIISMIIGLAIGMFILFETREYYK